MGADLISDVGCWMSDWNGDDEERADERGFNFAIPLKISGNQFFQRYQRSIFFSGIRVPFLKSV